MGTMIPWSIEVDPPSRRALFRKFPRPSPWRIAMDEKAWLENVSRQCKDRVESSKVS